MEYLSDFLNRLRKREIMKPAQQTEDRLLTPPEAAKITGYTPSRIYQLVAAGELQTEPYRIGNKDRIRIRESVARAHGGPALIPDSLPVKTA